MNRNFVLNILRQHARCSITIIKNYKKVKARYWEKATPDTERGKTAFAIYSDYREMLKQERRRFRLINEAIRSIKRG